MDNKDVDEEDFYKYLEFEREDEECAISTSARNYPTRTTRVTFDDDDDIIELTNYLTEVEFSDSDQEPTSHWQPEYGFSLPSSATHHPESLLMRSNITNPKTEYYLHYRGSVYCTEQEFGTFYMRSS
jgi:hypothetical protein